jgi:DNA-binding transcriptional MerR regulator
VAARTGVTVEAVRYYEQRRLLRPVGRTSGGFRLFGPESIERIQFIKQAQEIGFSLSEVASLVSGGETECQRMRDLIEVKLEEVDERLLRMRTFRDTLSRYLAECESALERDGERADCPVIMEITRRPRGPKGVKEKQS